MTTVMARASHDGQLVTRRCHASKLNTRIKNFVS